MPGAGIGNDGPSGRNATLGPDRFLSDRWDLPRALRV